MRARNLKPGFFKNEDLAECSPWARLCFSGLWLLADREGRMENRPKRIKGELFAFDSIEVEPLLDELEQHGFIQRYDVDGRGLIQILAFSKHQHPHHKEPPSDLPPPQSPRLSPHASAPESGAPPPSDGTQTPVEPRASPGFLPQDSTLHGVETRLIPDSGFRIPVPTGSSPGLPPPPAKPAALFPPSLPDWVPEAAWEGYLEMRRKIRKPPTPRAVDLVIASLVKLRAAGHDPGEVLDQSTRNSWIDVFPLRESRDGPKPAPEEPWAGGI
jgi:hypothetical protein